MGRLFGRNGTQREIVTVALVMGVTWGIFLCGTWTGNHELLRFGVYAFAAGGLSVLGALALTPARALPGMWQEEKTTLAERTPGFAIYFGAMASPALCLWLSPWAAIPTAAAMLAVTAAVVAVLFVSARRAA